MNKIIKRRQVIKALRTEKLATGQWFRHDSGATQGSYWDCSVCAVGAVMREVSILKWCEEQGQPPNHIADRLALGACWDDDVDVYLQRKQYLSALSAKFETLCNRRGVTKKHREVLVEWVKKNFPVEFEVTI